MNRRFRIAPPLLSLLLAALAFLLGATAASAQAVYERGNGADPVTLDPQRASTAAEANILRDLYEGLLVTGPFGGVIPGAAAGWETSPDGLVITFHLRAAIWSDGTTVSAHDFVRAFRRLVDPSLAAPDARLFLALENAEAILAGKAPPEALGVRAIDDATLDIRLVRPVPALLQLLARPSAMPVHKRLAAAADPPMAGPPVNGAYFLDRIIPGEGVWLVRNPSFHDVAAVAIETVVYRPFDVQRALREFADGRLLSNNDAPAFGLAERRAAMGTALRQSRFLGTYFYAANLAGALGDPRVRLAVALAIDRNALNEDVFGGTMIPSRAIVPAGIAGYRAPAEAGLGLNERALRLADATALLAEAGYGPGNPLGLRIAIAASDLNRRTAAAIAANLADIGIAVTIAERPPAEHYLALRIEADFDLASFAWIGDVNHVSEFLGLFAAGGAIAAGFVNAEFNALLAEAAVTPDRTVQTALYEAADRLLMRELPGIPLLHYAALNLVSPRLRGFEDNVVDIHLTRWISVAAEP